MAKDGEFVIPGKEVGYSEEYIPGEGTYEEGGKIYASATGTLMVDAKERKVSVKAKTSVPAVPKKGDVVIGVVADIKPQVAIVDLIKIRGVDRQLSGSISGSIHISRTRDAYVSDLSREFSAGDIVAARVVDVDRTPISLSTVGKELGIVKGYCNHCSIPLTKINNKLKCTNCNRVVHKKISSEYGEGKV
jgi:exosome complex component CSL4